MNDISDHSSTASTTEVQVSNNDTNWVDDHNAVAQSDLADSTLQVESVDETLTNAKGDASDMNNDIAQTESSNSLEEPSPCEPADAPPLPDEVLPLESNQSPPLPENEAPPLLVDEDVPPLPAEPLPQQDDGWDPVWEPTAQAFYFYNRFTGATQWSNPRVPDESVTQPGPPGVEIPTSLPTTEAPPTRPAGGYDPSIHGDYDPTAWYAQPVEAEPDTTNAGAPGTSADPYAATGAFNRFTGRWQAADIAPENYNDENKSKRQMNAFFDVDAAANSHDGRSLKAERSGKKLSKTELKEFKKKRKEKKETKRRAWLLD